MPNRRDHDHMCTLLGQIIVNPHFAQRFLNQPEATAAQEGYRLTQDELACLKRLGQPDLRRIRIRLGMG